MIRVKTEAPVYGGYVIARNEGIIFVKGALPGETVLARTVEKKKDYSVALTQEVLEPSPHRVQPFCPHFGACGGCHLQHAAYTEQVAMKNAIIKDSLKRLAGVEIEPGEPLAGGDTGYRHRAQFKVQPSGEANELAIGFFREGTRDVVPVDRCPLLADAINASLENIRPLLKIKRPFGEKNPASHWVKEVHITCGGLNNPEGLTGPEGMTIPWEPNMAEGMAATAGVDRAEEGRPPEFFPLAAYLKGPGFDPGLARQYAQAGFETVFFDDGSENGSGYSGKGYVGFDLLGFKYTVSPASFFQSNWRLNRKAVQAVKELLSPFLSPDKDLLDIYAGGGNFSIPLSGAVRRITAVEENASSVKDGMRNLELNGIRNMKFVSAPFEGKLQKNLKGPFEAAIVDPPRPGLSREAVKRILALLPERLLYISCNPATLARDVKKLLEKYRVASVRLIDFFPHTYHIEVLCMLEREKK